MTLADFQIQMQRLIEQYGKTAYAQPLVELIWAEVKAFSPEWWKKTVDDLIGSSAKAPRLTEIRPHISKEREREHWIEKRRNTADATDFMSKFSSEEKKEIARVIKNRVKYPDDPKVEQEYRSLMKVLK